MRRHINAGWNPDNVKDYHRRCAEKSLSASANLDEFSCRLVSAVAECLPKNNHKKLGDALDRDLRDKFVTPEIDKNKTR